MEKGAKTIAILLLVSLALGLAVLLLNPDYRETAKAIFRGQADQSPLWQSNREYYTEVKPPIESTPHDPE